MRSSTGRWVSGDDFFDREAELQIPVSRICDFNHVLWTGQRRMGKTSGARKLGRRLATKGWVMLFSDLENCDLCRRCNRHHCRSSAPGVIERVASCRCNATLIPDQCRGPQHP